MTSFRLWILALAMCAAGCLSSPVSPEAAATDDGSDDPALLYAPHVRDGRFFNPWHPFTPSFLKMVRFGLTRNPFDTSAAPVLPVVANDGSDLSEPLPSPRITWIGHATMAIHDGSDVVVTDPNFATRMFVVGRRTPPGLPLESIPADAMGVISHAHNDHLDADSIEALPATMHWFVPLGLAAWFRDRGRNDVVELDWWQSATRGRWTVTCLPAQHWSRRIELATNSTLWCSWLIDSGTARYFFAGDTGYFQGFREYGKKLAPIDVALLPIGAYEPRWFMREQHINPAEAYRAFRELGARYLIPMHWGTFKLSFEPLDLPPKELLAAADAAGGDRDRVKVLGIGGSFDVPPRP
ncbi:MAG TPA: MBL fold metallo-hydrolase [Candidatus Limnocylindrales bacterium]|nr:MBL fold metallo-hydrolase [Candidatus Limnocylindrales bacterium]